MTYNEYLNFRKTGYEKIFNSKSYGKLTGLVSVELNVTELCNRKCSFCPRTDSKVYPNKKLFMSLDTVSKISDDLNQNEFKGNIHICGFGEPLLHPQIADMVTIIKQTIPDCTLEITTNSDFVNKEFLLKIKDYVDMLVLDCYDGSHQIKKLTEILKHTSFSKYIFKELWPEVVNDTDFIENVLNNRSGAVKILKQHNYSNKKCYIPFYKTIIDWNGDMLLCCNDWFRQQKGLGNIHTSNLRDMWLSPVLQDIRKNLQSGKRIDIACKNCNVCGNIIGKESVELLIN